MVPGPFLQVHNGLRAAISGQSLVGDVSEEGLDAPELWQLLDVSEITHNRSINDYTV